MEKVQKKSLKRKILFLIVLVIFIISTVKTGFVLASQDMFEIASAEISKKSVTVDVSDFTVDKFKVSSANEFHQVGDSITYKLKVKNKDEKDYTITAVSDNNDNEYISLVYGDYVGKKIKANQDITIEITEKYTKENTDINNRNQSIAADIIFTLEDDEGNEQEEVIPITPEEPTDDEKEEPSKEEQSEEKKKDTKPISPQTGDNVGVYITISVVSLILLVLLSGKKQNKKYTGKRFKTFTILAITFMLLPTISKAVTKTSFEITFNNNIVLNDKLLVTCIIGDNETEIITKYNEKITGLVAPEKEGYEFDKWQKEDGSTFDPDEPITKDMKIKAIYKQDQYTISYHLNGGNVSNNPTTYKFDTDTFTLNNPEKYGYTFTGWTGTDLDDKTLEVTIPKGSTGNKEYTANWTPTNYSIRYTGLTEEELELLNNPTTYNIETENITLNNPPDRTDTDGDIIERFIGWKENASVSTTIVIPVDLGDKEFEAIWQAVDPNVYTITYNLNNGTLENENPTSFTKFKPTFTLNNPSKRGYTFEGWTGSNGTTPQKTVQVLQGTRQDLNFVANWTENNYTISYELNNGSVATANPENYTVNSGDILLNNPTKTGYTFKGWTGTDLTGETLEVTIPAHSIGDRTYTANFEANTYNIIFDKNTGNGIMDNQEMTYDVAADLSENVFTKTGYTFGGWNTKANGQGTTYQNKQNVLNIATEGNITLYAMWNANPYTIVFNANGGEGTMSNIQATYDDDINLTPNAFTYTNHIFTKWNTKPDGSGTNYTDGQTVSNLATEGEFTLYAQWKEVYTITFNPNRGTVDTESKTVIESEPVGELPTPILQDFIFEGWYDDLNYSNQITENSVISSNIEVFAKWRYKMRLVYSLDKEVTFNGSNGFITGDDLPEELYTKKFIDTGVSLFSSDNFKKDFEIGFEIVEYNPNLNDDQCTFVNAKFEDSSLGYPGVVCRRKNSTDEIELSGRAKPSLWPKEFFDYTTVQKVRIVRKSKKVYYSINDGELVKLIDFAEEPSRFNTPVTFGAAYDSSNIPIRYFVGKLKNFYILLEE
ncbi:MAG: InlB B-repeat-containing protein [Clostridia bacterium]|nr:InlB B-repeat-containing protein [Clostridia bacterium]